MQSSDFEPLNVFEILLEAEFWHDVDWYLEFAGDVDDEKLRVGVMEREEC
jgi:hypothetical protein